MPRIKSKAISWKLTLDEGLAAQIELRLANLSEGKPIYGARSALVTLLLHNWLDGKTSVPAPNDPNLSTKLEEAVQ